MIGEMVEVYLGVGEHSCELANRLGAVVIIVDALRASATLATLFERGVSEVWVVAETDQAWKLKEEMPDALLVGERNSVKIDGFDFNNSPTEILRSGELTGKRAIFTSTAGAKRILACRKAKDVLIGTTVNATAVANAAKNLAEQNNCPIVIVASGVHGRGGEWALEDIAASWVIADFIGGQIITAPPRPPDELEQAFTTSPHGRELIALGLGEDVNWCAQVDTCSSVPKVSTFQGFAAVLHHYSGSP